MARDFGSELGRVFAGMALALEADREQEQAENDQQNLDRERVLSGDGSMQDWKCW